MSLVSEALKKAEREAAAREAREKGQPAPFEVPLQPYRSRLRATRGGARSSGASASARTQASALSPWCCRLRGSTCSRSSRGVW